MLLDVARVSSAAPVVSPLHSPAQRVLAGAARGSGVMGRRVLVLACVRTVATFLLGFAIGAIFNLLLSSSLQLPTLNLAPALDGRWEAKLEVKFPFPCGRCVARNKCI